MRIVQKPTDFSYEIKDIIRYANPTLPLLQELFTASHRIFPGQGYWALVWIIVWEINIENDFDFILKNWGDSLSLISATIMLSDELTENEAVAMFVDIYGIKKIVHMLNLNKI